MPIIRRSGRFGGEGGLPRGCLPGGCLPGGVCLEGVCLEGACLEGVCLGVSAWRGVLPGGKKEVLGISKKSLNTNERTDRMKYKMTIPIPILQQDFLSLKILKHIVPYCIHINAFCLL